MSSSQAAIESPSTVGFKMLTVSTPSYPQAALDDTSYSLERDADIKVSDAFDKFWTPSIPSDRLRDFTRTPRSTERRAKHADDKVFVRRQLLDKCKTSTDWRIPLSMLQRAAGQLGVQESEGTAVIIVPEGALPRLSGDPGGALWEMKTRNGCEVEILGIEDRIGDCRPIKLRGTPQAREIAKETIASAVSGADNPAPDGPNATILRPPNVSFARSESWDCEVRQKEPPARAVWSHVTHQQRADEIGPPETWTPTTLANYVEDLTESRVTRSMHDRLHKKGESYVDKVANIICELFNDPSKEQIIFVRALNSALRFLYKYNLVHLVRAVFLRAEDLKVHMVPETFNIMLRGAATAKDLHNFTFILQMMIKRSVRPNAATWVAFLMAVESKPVKLQIINVMRSMGILQDRSIFKDTAAQVISGEMVGYLKSGQDVHAFMSDMDKRFGPEWLSVDAANRILHDLGGQGAISEAHELFKIMDNRFLRPNTISFNTLLAHCLHQRKVFAALQLLDSMKSEWTLDPDGSTFDLVFKLGWDRCYYNFCRVTWHYACMAGYVSHRMRDLVLQSLLWDPAIKTKTVKQAWKASAGNFIVGNDISDNGGRGSITLQPDHYSSNNTDVSSGLRESPNLPDKSERKNLARLFIASDLKSVSSRRPVQPFSHLLQYAWLKDTMVLNKKALPSEGDVYSPEWRIRHAIPIPCRPASKREISQR